MQGKYFDAENLKEAADDTLAELESPYDAMPLAQLQQECIRGIDASVLTWKAYLADDAKEKPVFDPEDDQAQYRGCQMVPAHHDQMRLHILGQDLYAQNFMDSACLIRTRRKADTPLVLFGTSCIANLALLKFMANPFDLQVPPRLIVLDLNAGVDQFWDIAKGVNDASLCDYLADETNWQWHEDEKQNPSDVSEFLAAVKPPSGDVGMHRMRNETIFGCENTIFKSRLEVEEFYKSVLETMVFVPVNYMNLDCDRIHCVRNLARAADVRLLQRAEAVHYVSNIFSFLKEAPGMGAWVAGLEPRWVLASDVNYSSGAPSRVSVVEAASTEDGASAWTGRTIAKALDPPGRKETEM